MEIGKGSFRFSEQTASKQFYYNAIIEIIGEIAWCRKKKLLEEETKNHFIIFWREIWIGVRSFQKMTGGFHK
jgi:hypothetical protein